MACSFVRQSQSMTAIISLLYRAKRHCNARTMFGRRFSARSEGGDVRLSGEMYDYTQAVSYRTQGSAAKPRGDSSMFVVGAFRNVSEASLRRDIISRLRQHRTDRR